MTAAVPERWIVRQRVYGVERRWAVYTPLGTFTREFSTWRNAMDWLSAPTDHGRAGVEAREPW